MMRDPPVSYQHRREKDWGNAGIMYHGGPLSWTVYVYVRDIIQKGRCAVCGRDFRLFRKGAESADHDHKTHEFRGVLCSKKTGCNLAIIGRYEHDQAKFITYDARVVAARYLEAPPAVRAPER